MAAKQIHWVANSAGTLDPFCTWCKSNTLGGAKVVKVTRGSSEPVECYYCGTNLTK